MVVQPQFLLLARRLPSDHLSRLRPGEAGFLLPLSISVSLLLVLSAVSVQTATLHSHRLVASELRQRQQSDVMASAAQQVASRLSGPYACLLPVASEAWVQPVPGCPAALDPALLFQGGVGSTRYRLISWKPPGDLLPGAAQAGQLRLALHGQQGSWRYALGVAQVAEGIPALHVVGVRGMGR